MCSSDLGVVRQRRHRRGQALRRGAALHQDLGEVNGPLAHARITVGKRSGEDVRMPVLYFTQLLGMAFGLDELHELRTLEPEGCGSRLYELASGLDRSKVTRVLAARPVP